MHPFFTRFTKDVEGIPRHAIYPRLIGGKLRLVYEPNEAMREVQKRIIVFLRMCAPPFRSSSSRKGGRGAVKNARRHLRSTFVYKTDIACAFPSTDVERLIPHIARAVRKRYAKAPDVDAWREFLGTYSVSRKGGLPEGALTSPFLFEWYCELFLDRSIRASCQNWGMTYTRYVDDLVISGLDRMSLRRRSRIHRNLEQAHFSQNHSKTTLVQLSGNPVRITGTMVGRKNQVSVPRAWLKKTEVMLYQANTLGAALCGHKPEVLVGRMRYLLDVIRGKYWLNALEEKVLRSYEQYEFIPPRDLAWVHKVLVQKGKKEPQ